MNIVIVVLLVLLVVGGLPHWGYSANWGYGPSGIGGLLLLLVVLWLLFGR